MSKTFTKIAFEPDALSSNGYDVWEVFKDNNFLGWYFVPEGVSGKDYDDALISAKSKLMALGLTELEVNAIIGRQFF
jgi:hypothetical protein